MDAALVNFCSSSPKLEGGGASAELLILHPLLDLPRSDVPHSDLMTTVLLVEDSLTETELLTCYLRQAGLTVVSFTNGEEAQLKFQIHNPDLVLLDVILPGQSGFELCRKLKTSSKTRHIPVVICSTKDTEADKLWGSMLGADAYLPKPVDSKELINLVFRLTAIHTRGM